MEIYNSNESEKFEQYLVQSVFQMNKKINMNQNGAAYRRLVLLLVVVVVVVVEPVFLLLVVVVVVHVVVLPVVGGGGAEATRALRLKFLFFF